jgi:microtubule-associated protein, RP/EB family
MRAKKLGRHELLSWANQLTQSDYPKIENLSDGVAFCQIFDAFYPNIINLNPLRMNSKSMEDWEKNLSLVNDILLKIKSYKQIDSVKLSKCKFTPNFEFLQFVYDFLAKNFGDPLIRYSAYEKRLEILKYQYGSKMTDVKKFLPTHLIPNDLILKMDKQKFLGQQSSNNIAEKIEIKNDEKEKISQDLNSYPPMQPQINSMLDKYRDFFSILKDDLRKMMDKNISMTNEINDIEEERQYYLEKINNVLNFCEKKKSQMKNKDVSVLDDIVKMIKHVPEDFK